MKKFFIKTLGCKTNQVDSALLAENLVYSGFEQTDVISHADYYILNSCSVTHIADSKNLAYLRRAKRENPNIKTVITGCMAQLQKEKLINDNIADFVIGNYEKNDIAKILQSNVRLSVSDIFSHKKFLYKKLHQINRARATVKIQDGCNNRCSYCTIPFARGNNRSDSIENIVEQINLFADEGYFEIVLTGIHIGQWGLDFTPKKELLNLLEKIEETKIYRYRLGSLNPNELTYDFIEFLSKSRKFCPHFHLSLQSCCNKTLKSMNRNYDESKINEIVSIIDKNFKLPFIGCDIIAGFPNESEEDFSITVNNIKNLNVTKLHIFPYSRRKGTIADNLDNQINNLEKKRRCNILQEISDKKLLKFFQSNLGMENEVIIEKKRDKKSGLLKGVTNNYINVLIEADDTYKNSLQHIKIVNFSNDKEKMLAKIII